VQLVSKKALLMALHSEDMRRLARLARLDLPEEAQTALAGQLNTFFGLVEQMNAVDTDGLEPLAHPADAMGEAVTLRLRPDAASEPATEAVRAANQRSAPAVERGLYLVPKVIE